MTLAWAVTRVDYVLPASHSVGADHSPDVASAALCVLYAAFSAACVRAGETGGHARARSDGL